MHKRVTAALAAAVMVITNVMSPATAFAGEESVQAADTNSELTETEAAFFNVCIPYFREMDVNYDSKKYQETCFKLKKERRVPLDDDVFSEAFEMAMR